MMCCSLKKAAKDTHVSNSKKPHYLGSPERVLRSSANLNALLAFEDPLIASCTADGN